MHSSAATVSERFDMIRRLLATSSRRVLRPLPMCIVTRVAFVRRLFGEQAHDARRLGTYLNRDGASACVT